jgi:hypothetical protein
VSFGRELWIGKNERLDSVGIFRFRDGQNPSGVISGFGKCYGKDVNFGRLVGWVIVNCGVANAV